MSHLPAEPPKILLIEAFYGGSHKQLVDLLHSEMANSILVTMKDKKWHWRMRTSAAYLASAIPDGEKYSTIFVSSVTNLAELIGLRPQLSQAKKIVYFHENQLVYPVRQQKERDFQFGYSQIVSCLVADQILFNSSFNMESFLSSIPSFINMMPDYKPKNLIERIQPKCHVLYFPVFKSLGQMGECRSARETKTGPLHIVWPHRWEHDKNPILFFETLLKLKDELLDFRVSVLGQQFSEIPEIFGTSKAALGEEVLHWGFQETKESYYSVLRAADVVVSTADHEFFGVSMVESVACGCYPLCPNRLSYPEIYASEYLYNTPAQLLKKLRYFCKNPEFVRRHIVQVNLAGLTWDSLNPKFHEYFSTPANLKAS